MRVCKCGKDYEPATYRIRRKSGKVKVKRRSQCGECENRAHTARVRKHKHYMKPAQRQKRIEWAIRDRRSRGIGPRRPVPLKQIRREVAEIRSIARRAPVQAMMALLRREEPHYRGAARETVRWRAKYKFDPVFRASEILRARAKDSHAAALADGTLTGEVVARLFAHATLCPYCTLPMKSQDKSLDHVIPLSRGGLHSLTNVVVCCLKCNKEKRTRTPEEWRAA